MNAVPSALFRDVFVYCEKMIRVAGTPDAPLFVALDVCAILDITNSRDAVARLDDDERGVVSIDTRGGVQNLSAVTQSGLYSLIMGSRKPEAKAFKKWVTATVLPTIRKTGGYSINPAYKVPQTFAEALRAHADVVEAKERLALEVSLLKPKAEFYDTVTESQDHCDMQTAAKVLNLPYGRTTLFEKLRDLNVLDRKNQPMQRHIDSGYFRVVESSWNSPEGEVKVNFKTLVSQKGLDFIRRTLAKDTLPNPATVV